MLKPKVTLYKSVFKKNEPDVIELSMFFDCIRDGTWQDLVLKCRTITDKEKRDNFKANHIPTVTMTGEFTAMRNDALVELNGYIAMDFDDTENPQELKERLTTDPYLKAVWISVSGKGVRPLFRIDPKRYEDSYYGLMEYTNRVYGQPSDNFGVSKPFVASYDPDIYISENEPKQFDQFCKEVKIEDKEIFIFVPQEFEDIVSEIERQQLSICDNYAEYLKVCFAISDKFGETGRRYFHSICSPSAKYKKRDADKQYDYCLKRRGSGVNFSSFFYLCKEAGIDIVSETTKKVKKITINGKKAGLSKKQILENLEKFEGITNAEASVEQVWSSKIKGDSEENIVTQLEIFINSHYSLRRNEVTKFIELNGKPLSSVDINTLYLAAYKQLDTLRFEIFDKLINSDFIISYNPFLEFFEKYEGRKPIGSIAKLANSIKNEEPGFTEIHFKKWLVGMISAMHGEHSPLMFILCGKETGTGKTQFFRRILPKEFSGYYAESKLEAGKDDELLMTQNILIVDDEMSGKLRKEIKKLNELTSKQFFSLRAPYGRHNEKYLRLAVLGATSNFKELDTSGEDNRRMLIVYVESIDHELYNSVDKIDLFMEAYWLYKSGFKWEITTKEDKALLNKNIHEYAVVEKEEELFDKYFDKGEEVYTASDIVVELYKLTNQNLIPSKISRILLVKGFEHEVRGRIKYWKVKTINRTIPNYF